MRKKSPTVTRTSRRKECAREGRTFRIAVPRSEAGKGKGQSVPARATVPWNEVNVRVHRRKEGVLSGLTKARTARGLSSARSSERWVKCSEPY
jgi:hypothetical protein